MALFGESDIHKKMYSCKKICSGIILLKSFSYLHFLCHSMGWLFKLRVTTGVTLVEKRNYGYSWDRKNEILHEGIQRFENTRFKKN